MIAATMGFPVIIIMPRNMSEERKCMMRVYGAEIIEVGDNAFKDAIALRDEMCANNATYFNPQQFSNPDNIECHFKTTGIEIIKECLTICFYCWFWNCGTIMGVNKASK